MYDIYNLIILNILLCSYNVYDMYFEHLFLGSFIGNIILF